MSILLVPHESTSSAVSIWLAAVGQEAPAAQLAVGAREPQALSAGWNAWPSGGPARLWHQTVTVDGLEPGTRFPVRVLEGGVERAAGVAATLPSELPRLDERPFICLLGSCFAHLSDQSGAAGAAYVALPAGARPAVKFLCGDQVYLDAPFPKYLFNVYRDADLQAELLSTYVASWSQAGDQSGFARLLAEGATYFSSDDHELWNNAPNPTPIVRATWWPLGDGGAAWLRIASALYDTFQASYRSASFKVGQLSFRVQDTRLGRTRDRSRFSDAEDMTALGRWVDELDGPGVLVLGQPLLVEPTGLKGHLTDWGLADYRQYAELVRAIFRSEHDVLVLTGDVHYGRVAGCRLPSGASLIEIIASPFALIDSRFGGTWYPPPRTFPASAVAGVTQLPTWTSEHRVETNHFATLEFAAHGPRVQLTVRAWPISDAPGRASASRLAFRQILN
ncbi:hypothetical protein BH24CHL6_BH24CHL6_08500 [soil metagenome]